MNIFVSDACPAQSAKNLDDKRVVKMVLESAQMLSTCLNEFGFEGPYRSTHVNHPCNVWVRQGRSNYLWLVDHFVALCQEYTNRYGKIHKCEQYLADFEYYSQFIPTGNTDFINCAANKELGLNFRDEKCVFTAYKLYLNARWENDKRIPTWYGV